MIDSPVRPLTLVEQQGRPLARLETWVCSRCKKPIGQGVLTVGSVVQLRCHHSMTRPDGKRETCGWLNTMAPSR